MTTLREKQERERRRYDLLQRREARRAAAILKAAQAQAQRQDRKPTKAEADRKPGMVEEWQQRRAERAASTAAAMEAVQAKLSATRDAFAARHAAQLDMMRYWLHRAGFMADRWKKWLARRAEVAAATLKRGQDWAAEKRKPSMVNRRDMQADTSKFDR
jgi:hypothetical protein